MHYDLIWIGHYPSSAFIHDDEEADPYHPTWLRKWSSSGIDSLFSVGIVMPSWYLPYLDLGRNVLDLLETPPQPSQVDLPLLNPQYSGQFALHKSAKNTDRKTVKLPYTDSFKILTICHNNFSFCYLCFVKREDIFVNHFSKSLVALCVST